jgi:serine/threonine protein kinase, bacterial
MNRSELSLKFPRRLRLPVSPPTTQTLPRLDRRQQALLKLHHPQIGPMYAYRESGRPRVGCELLPGTTLADRVRWRRRAPYNLSETLELLAPVAKALEYAHSQGIAHGNLHPAAIVYLSSETILTGFAGSAEPGPAIYRAPEQQSNISSAQADVYALAVIAHELLTGYPPGSAAASTTTLPQEINAVLARAVSQQSRQRPRSPQSLIDALRAAQCRGRQRGRTSWRHAGGYRGIVLLMLALSIGVGAILGLLV